jgi:hypothetical protein
VISAGFAWPGLECRAVLLQVFIDQSAIEIGDEDTRKSAARNCRVEEVWNQSPSYRAALKRCLSKSWIAKGQIWRVDV